ncbi:MAG TPA: hypothetical protein VFX58_14815, partial [Chitinophagaceae bacterium]|nr:hypothetical protein [Chitinophagaceae bacterium]
RHLLKIPFSKVYGLRDYIQLIRDSLPQAGVVFLNASIARIDWILLGLLATPAITAEYSFAYKVFELSPLPLLILAPILLSRFSKYFGQYPDGQLTQRKTELGMLIRFEMIAATSIPLILNMVWTPLVDSLTVNKYGAVNEKVFFLLSCCSPFLYINNLLWSVLFAQNKLTLILRITLFTFLILLIGDLVSIPLFAAQGAAFVYLLAIIAEYLNYLRYTGLYRLRETWLSPLLCMGAALVSGVPAFLLTDEHWIRLAISLPVYSFLLLATKQLCISDIRYIVGLVNLKKIEIT